MTHALSAHLDLRLLQWSNENEQTIHEKGCAKKNSLRSQAFLLLLGRLPRAVVGLQVQLLQVHADDVPHAPQASDAAQAPDSPQPAPLRSRDGRSWGLHLTAVRAHSARATAREARLIEGGTGIQHQLEVKH